MVGVGEIGWVGAESSPPPPSSRKLKILNHARCVNETCMVSIRHPNLFILMVVTCQLLRHSAPALLLFLA